MTITVTELKQNLDIYLSLAETEEIFIAHNNKVIAKLTSPHQDRVALAKSLLGVLPPDVT